MAPATASFRVPGRIELLGKHTDYAGGSSITCATTRGFRLEARAGSGAGVSIRSADGSLHAELPIRPDVHAEGWANYVATVVRRVTRNAPGAARPSELVFSSDLPPAAGLSSSSAFMIAVFLGLDAASGGRIREAIVDEVDSLPRLAEYLACVENGASFGRLEGERGVGTAGGSQDHTAILCSLAGRLRRYRYAPYADEGEWPVIAGQSIVVAASGVEAAKTGAAMEAYNRASLRAREATRMWSAETGFPARHLADALARDGAAAQTVRSAAARTRGAAFAPDSLARRVTAFAVEMDCVERASRALGSGDLAAFAAAVRASQEAADAWLDNQVAETIYLATSAAQHGATAASAFGAGFGGSVWALVPAAETDRFVSAWQRDYAAAFPVSAGRAMFVTESAGAGARRDEGAPAW